MIPGIVSRQHTVFLFVIYSAASDWIKKRIADGFALLINPVRNEYFNFFFLTHDILPL
jgi:hypothetical protein